MWTVVEHKTDADMRKGTTSRISLNLKRLAALNLKPSMNVIHNNTPHAIVPWALQSKPPLKSLAYTKLNC